MPQEIVDFTYSVLSGVTSNSLYDSLKSLLGLSIERKLKKELNNNNREAFEKVLKNILLENEELLNDISDLIKDSKESVTNINQNNIHGDNFNVGGNVYK